MPNSFVLTPQRQPARRQAANITLDPALIDDAKALGVNLSAASESGVRAAVREARAQRWQQENAEAIESWNQYVAEHGLPLAGKRLF